MAKKFHPYEEKSVEYKLKDLKERTDLIFKQIKEIKERLEKMEGAGQYEERIKRLEGYHL